MAHQLRSSPMSLYRYVANRDELLEAMLEHASRDMPSHSDAATPRARLTERFTAAHDFLAERLWIPQLLTRGDLVATSTFGFADVTIADLLEAGLTPDQAIFAFGTCWQLMLGELLDRHPAATGHRPTQRQRAVRTIDRTEFPHWAVVLDHLDPLQGPPPDRFAETIGLLLTGILATYAPDQV